MRKFGLIGKSLKHSFSKTYFENKFKSEKILDASYGLFELKNLEEFKTLIKTYQFSGLNVTIPYKTDIISYLDEIDTTAQKINAVNTIYFKNGKSIGYNTDFIGFQKSIRPFLANTHRRALILGTGGASKAIKYCLKELDISYIEVSRTPNTQQLSYKELNKALIQSIQIIINCTPLGTFPNINEHPSFPYEYLSSNHFAFDLIYNPLETVFLAKSKAQGAITSNGLNMLKIQAEESWKLWNKK